MKKILSTLAFTILLISATYGQVDKDYAKSLRKMFKVSGTEETYQTIIQQMFGMFKQQYPQVEEEIWDEFEKEFSKTSLDDLTEMLVPVYSKYLTIEDLEAMIEFYSTPTGKKFARNTPMITQESMQIGQEWGLKMGEDFIKKMQEKGY